jgi:hypothetical protein
LAKRFVPILKEDFAIKVLNVNLEILTRFWSLNR